MIGYVGGSTSSIESMFTVGSFTYLLTLLLVIPLPSPATGSDAKSQVAGEGNITTSNKVGEQVNEPTVNMDSIYDVEPSTYPNTKREHHQYMKEQRLV